ncbi:MAG: transporter substrate-binding domain-containing protein [Ruminiclostridium sp.]|nr:transporter substrate-binding domain-containing protein [Ruminiclostridium sp.]
MKNYPKKFMLASGLAAVLLMTSCNAAEKPQNADPLSTTFDVPGARAAVTVHIGILESPVPIVDETIVDAGEDTTGTDRSAESFSSLTELQLSLMRGDVDSVKIADCTARYMAARNYEFAAATLDTETPFNVGFAMMLNNTDAELCERLSKAISEIKADGTMKTLEEKYINGFIDGKEPEPVAYEHFDGAETVTFAFTGDLPPMDFISADGIPAGFNTALISEIGKRLHINIKSVNIESGSRTIALMTGRAQVVFWTPVLDNVTEAMYPDGMTITDIYHTEVLSEVKRKS